MVSTRMTVGLQCMAAMAIATMSLTNATPIELNPFTPGGENLALGKKHPAYGAMVPQGSIALKPVLPTAESVGKTEDAEESVGVLTRTTKPPAVPTSANGTTAKRQLSWEDEDREMNGNVTSKDLSNIEAFFKTKVVVNYKELTKYNKGSTENPPWASSYWPIYEDGINLPWNPEDKMSASEKYARAYGQDPKAFMQKISEINGIESQNTRQNCTKDDDCANLKDGSGCGKRAGATTGYCIPKWFGICHAWSPAAIEEREPRCAVTKNDITFQPFDIKALITQTYDGSHLNTVFTGTRFNGADEPENLDEDGRYIDATRRDLGPGFFHIAIFNIMGIHKKGFIIDVSSGSEVWNQPVRGYEVVSATEVTTKTAVQAFFPNRTEYVFNKDADKLMFIQLKFSYIVESNENGPMIPTKIDKYTQTVFYEYLLELNTDGDIIGGEWVRNSRKEHPDFLWFPKGQPDMDLVTDVGLKYREVRELLDASADCKEIPKNGTYPLATPTPLPGQTPVPTTKAPAPTGETGGDATPAPTTPAPTTPKPTPVPTTAPPTTPSKTVPAPAPVPSPTAESAKGTVVPVVKPPAKTPAPATPSTPAPTPSADADADADDDNDDDDTTPSTTKPSKCKVLL